MKKYPIEFYCVLFYGRERNVLVSDFDIAESAMLKALDELRSLRGVAALTFDKPGVGPVKLSVRSNQEKYLVTLLEYHEDTSSTVKTITGNQKDGRLEEFEGDFYPTSSITKDFDFVKTVFSIFLKEGNVTSEYMS